MSSTNPSDHTADDHGGPSGPPPQEVIDRGYEADVYDARTVLSVPLLVVLFFILAFATVTVIFSFIAYPKPNPQAHPGAVERNKVPLNDRLGRLDRGPKNGNGQPRLEPLRMRAGQERAITSPETPEGNPPELHPEDLVPNKERFPALYATEGNRLGLDKTMGLGNEELKQLFPVQEHGSKPPESQHVPTSANAGRGAEDSRVIMPPAPKDEPAPKQEAPKKEEPKKEEPKPEQKEPPKQESPKKEPPKQEPPKPKGGK